MKTLGLLLLLAGATSAAFAGPIQVPEVDGASAAGAVALVAGTVMILRARFRK